ncbi:3'-5' exoribonuclease [Aestuariispira insulae]|uniref:Uncharacterized protein DUF5051 n=1 Tax=Aestuariispira insulae TaxID=1461337 RepID=A0A3D9H462_9PROT|nr:3'-5' exoribonuclease [Aestuariispira insulae]RED44294.1 uncharacterized protein DUF5051 [Aestuariispira insulae]
MRNVLAFIDAEFTGEHKFTTLVSLGIVGEGDEKIYLSFNDYDRNQVTPWLEENVLAHIDERESVSQEEGFRILADWFESYRKKQSVSLVSFGKTHDLILLFELWHKAYPDREYFHNLYCLPDYLNHAAHFDLTTIFALAGLDPDLDRGNFIEHSVSGQRHEALFDALVVRECFMRCMGKGVFPKQKLI